jgi:hypothetical protein
MSLVEPATACMRGGSRVTIRLGTTNDEPALFGFLSGLCSEARRLRFFSGAVDVGEAAHLSAESDPHRAGFSRSTKMEALSAMPCTSNSARMSRTAPKWRSR